MLKDLIDFAGLLVVFAIVFIAYHHITAVEAAIIAAKGN